MSDGAFNEVPPPRANAALLGQGAAAATLLEAYRSGRLPHAWLLAGPRGVGKATLAYRFARFLLAGGSDGGNLFGEPPRDLALDPSDQVFRRVASGGHPDLLSVERMVDEKTASCAGRSSSRMSGRSAHSCTRRRVRAVGASWSSTAPTK